MTVGELAARGIHLWAEDGRLRYRAPAGVLTPEIRAYLHAHKAELIALLSEPRTYPPSHCQRRFWTLQRLNPADSFYNVPCAFQLSGDLDVELLRASCNAIVRRHESLRTTLEERDGELTQVVAAGGQASLRVAETSPEMLAAVLREEMERPFDLAREAGFRALLVRTGERRHVLMLCLHNTLYDQRSMLVLLRELSAHYAALRKGRTPDLPAPAQYSEYVRWQQAQAENGMDERLHYWKEWFARGQPPAWDWTPRRPPDRQPGFRAHVSWLRSTAELTGELQELSQRNGVTLYLTLLAAYTIALRRFNGCADMVIGTTYSNRHHWKFASLIGAAIDVPALRVDTTDDPTLETLLARLRALVAAALTYQDVPLERLRSQLPFAGQQGPLFRVVFTFFEPSSEPLQLSGVEVTYLEEVLNDLSRPEVYLCLWENSHPRGRTVIGHWLHRQAIFDGPTAEEMNRTLAALVQLMIVYPKGTVTELLSRV